MAREFVLDNSIAIAWCFQDQTNVLTEAVLRKLEISAAHVPAIWPLEVGNVLAVTERKGCISKADVARILSFLQNLPIIVEQESPERMLTEILSLARDYRLSTYDASYLDLAMRLGLPLATQDKELRAAANKCKVPLVK
jgi:predicted nucleic acid-binding protein